MTTSPTPSNIPFHKYEGTGNDFILIDNRFKSYLSKEETALIELMCDRRFGIGADGLILLQNKLGFDFEMVYFNSDGKESSMCGNGGRCITAFANDLGIVKEKYNFLAIDGPHEAILKEDHSVELKMMDVENVEAGSDYFILDTGSPHYIIFVEDLDDIKIVENAHMIRYSERFRKAGINVNFVEEQAEHLLIATYERGIEAETLSCGTGVTAAALSYALKQPTLKRNKITIKAKGGILSVRFEKKEQKNSFENIWLCGKATHVYSGTYLVSRTE